MTTNNIVARVEYVFPESPFTAPGYIYSYDDGLINLLDPNPEQISIKGIARGLANICRWGGQGSRFLSVAQHSVLVYLLWLDQTKTHLERPIFCGTECLLHDGWEGYLGDIPKPLKEHLPDYQRIEAIWKAMFIKKFGLSEHVLEIIKNEVEKAALRIEYRALFLKDKEEFTEIFKRYNYPCHLWSPRVAMDQFLRTYRML